MVIEQAGEEGRRRRDLFQCRQRQDFDDILGLYGVAIRFDGKKEREHGFALDLKTA